MQEQIKCKRSQRRRAQCADVCNERTKGPLAASTADCPPFAAVDHSPALRARSPVAPQSAVRSERCAKNVSFDLLHCNSSLLIFCPPRRPLHDLPAYAGGVDSAAAGSAPKAGAWRWAWEDGELGPPTKGNDWAGPAWMPAASVAAEQASPESFARRDPFEPAPATRTKHAPAAALHEWWCATVSDLPPAGDPAAGWATFDALLPEILLAVAHPAGADSEF